MNERERGDGVGVLLLEYPDQVEYRGQPSGLTGAQRARRVMGEGLPSSKPLGQDAVRIKFVGTGKRSLHGGGEQYRRQPCGEIRSAEERLLLA